MLSRKAKAAFYFAAGPLMAVNGALYRRFRAPKHGIVKVHLGPGQAKYIDGWINIDANMFTGRCDVWADLRNALPFPDASVDAIYSHSIIEHLPDLKFHFGQMYRCLKPGGVFRVGGPNGDSAIQKFQEGDREWFPDFPDKRSSLGGRFENFIFCRQEHLTILTFSYLAELAANAGFGTVTLPSPVTHTRFPAVFDAALAKEYENDFACPHSLVVEGQKPH